MLTDSLLSSSAVWGCSGALEGRACWKKQNVLAKVLTPLLAFPAVCPAQDETTSTTHNTMMRAKPTLPAVN